MVRSRRADRFVAMLLVSVSLAAKASAQDNYWQGSNSFWDLASNWTLGLPAEGQRLFIGYSPYAFAGGTSFRSGTTRVGSLFSKNTLTITGGSLALASTSEASQIDSDLDLKGGSLGGAADLVVKGLTTLTGGILGGSGRTTAVGGVTISGSGTVRLADTRTLENQGALTWSGAMVNVDSGATVANAAGAKFAANAAAQWTGGQLLNAGTLTHSSATTLFSGISLTNTGSVESSGGDLRFSGVAAFTNTGTFIASSNGRISFVGGTFGMTGSGFATTANGIISFAGATLTEGAYAPWTIPAATAADSIRISGSKLEVAFIKNSGLLGFYGSNTLDGVAGNSGFRFVNGGVQSIQNGFDPGGKVVLNYGARLAFAGDRTLDYPIDVQEASTNPTAGIIASPGSKVKLSSQGSWTGTGGRIDAQGAAFDFQNDASVVADSVLVIDVAGGTLTNTGTIVGKAQDSEYGGGSILAVGSGSFVNTGVVRGDGGGVNLTGTPGASFSNEGSMQAINGGSVGIFKTTSAATVGWSNSGVIGADGVDSRLFLGGTFSRSALGSFLVTHGASALVYGGTYDNAGQTLTVDYRNEWQLSNGGRLLGGNLINSANLGFENVYTTEVLENVALDGGLNLGEGGRVRLVGTTHLNGLTSGNGRIDLTGDTTLDHDVIGGIAFGSTKDGSTITLAKGSTYEGTLRVNAIYPQVTNVNLVNRGTMRGTDSGYLQGTLTNSGLLEQSASSLTYYSRKDFVNEGIVRSTANGNIYIGGDGRTLNMGTIIATDGGAIRFDSDAQGKSLVNTGTIRADGLGSAILFDMADPFTVSSLGDVGATNGGVLSVAGGGRLDLAKGTLVLGTGLTGSWRIEGGGTIFNGSIANSEQLGLGSKLNRQILRNVSVDHGLKVGDGFVSLEGAFRSGGPIDASGEGRIYTETSRPIDYAIRFDGAANENGEIELGPQTFGSSVVIAPNGEISGRNLSLEKGSNALKVINEGLIQARGPEGRISFDGEFQNVGTMQATEGGTLLFDNYGTLLNVSGTTLVGGTYRADANSRIVVNRLDVVTNAANIVLNGPASRLEDAYGYDALRNLSDNQGSLSISGGRNLAFAQGLRSSGTLGIGPASTLSILGAFEQTSTSRLNLGLGLDGIGTLEVTGDVTVAGTLNVSLLDGFTPVAGSEFTFLTYTGTLNGSFAVVSANYSLIYNPGSVSLKIDAVPEPLGLISLGLGVLAILRRRKA